LGDIIALLLPQSAHLHFSQNLTRFGNMTRLNWQPLLE
jgi:hypothetical protein